MATQPHAPAAPEERAREVFQFCVEHLDAMPDDGNKYELLDGKLLVSPAPTRDHEYVVREIFRILDRHLDGTDGEAFASQINNRYADKTLFIPDITVFAPGGPDPVREDVTRLGDLVVEVSSPSTRMRDMMFKREVYEREGVAEYWFIDRQVRTFTVHVLGDDGYRSTSHAVDEPAASTLLAPLTITLADVLP